MIACETETVVLPLSHAQRGLWFLYRLRPESSAYNLATAGRVHGDLPAEKIRAFFQGWVDRYAVLRTAFRFDGEEPVQEVRAVAEVAFEEVDAADWTDAELRAGVEEAAWHSFDLERGPVFRVVLFQQGAERLLVVSMHHIVADFGALTLFFPSEGGREYAEFVSWQADLLAGPEGERLWSYWRERLAGLPELDLPADRLRPESAPERGRARWREIGPEVLAPLKALARSRRSTLYVALLAAYEALLHRLTGQEDFAVGSPAAGRPKGFARTFGYFTNPLVQRADVAGDPSFRELVDRTRQSVSEALDHQHFPLSLLVERLRPGSALFRTMFVLHQGPEGLVSLVLGEGGGHLPLDGFDLESLPLARRAAQFDLTLAAGERRGTLGLELLYDAARFDDTTAARWLEHLANLLAGAVENPDAPVSELPLLSPWERHQLLVEVNAGSGGDTDLPWSTLHEGFEQQAGRTPDAVALVDAERQLTYQELNARAAELAERLRALGVGPETVVGVRLPRTADLVVSLLGILKSGAAYLPLDPSYPEERVAFMVEDAGARLILGEEGLPPLPKVGRGWERGLGGEGLAYLIYTSGSTGRPKGVAIEHAAAVRLVAWAGQAFSSDELRGVLAATSVSFDLSIFEIFVPLSFGGAVILAENALALATLPARGSVTLINTVPSALAGLLELGALPPSVRTVNLAGEPLRRALADQILAAGVKLWDLYGPSEDTTYSTGAVVEASDLSEPVIGWPVAGSRGYVVDRGLQPLPLGIPGELCLGGGGLARGYLGRPELTAERFIPDPFGGQPGARLYRTGDLVRRRFDGALDYLGRLDHQVKIRGFRIELGEVEAALLALPGVREAVVVARDGVLAAYVSLAGGGSEEALRDTLREKLPAPFVPSAFVVLDALPRTPNGKVDRKALPAPVSQGEGASEVPVGIVEEVLAAIWADLLGRSEIGRTDRFFDLGGHSLLAARAVARVREALGVEIPLGAFFEEPTLAGLARRIEAAGEGRSAAPILRAPRDLPLPLSYAQQRFWFLDRLEPGSATYNVPLVLRFDGPLDVEALIRALAGIVRRHEALRTTFAAGEEGPLQRIDPPPADFPLASFDLSDLQPEAAAAEAQRLEQAEARRPFDLGSGLLIRGLLLRWSLEEHRLVLVLHHIACDGWSLGLLLSDLAALYAGVAIAEPPLQYADFAVWQRREPVPAELLAAWRDRLAGAPALELPADRLDPARRSASGSTLLRLLPADLAAGLATAARPWGATLFMALLAGFDALLHRHTGQTDLVVGTAVAGRGRVELEGVVGCFVNTLALRIDLGSTKTFGDLLTEVRSVALAAFRDQDVPFERLVEEIHPERDSARRPFPRALLVLQNEPLTPPVLPGIAVEVEPVETGAARSDLALSFHEVPGGLFATIERGADVFDEPTVARLWERFLVLLAGAAADPLVPLSDLPLMTEAERQEIAGWGRARSAADPAAPTAVQLFERRASETPEAIALVDGDRAITFAELNRRANRLAAHLRILGVGPGRIVGLQIERSAEMVAGLLGIWKAGGAYLPLDPAYPESRRAFLVADALGDEPIVVTHVEDGGDERDPESVSGPGDPAYVIYTSGTTGTPKGVVVEHRQLSALLTSVQRAFGFEANDRMPCVAPFSFDIFLFELLAPLLAGGTSVLVGLRPSLDVDRLVAGLGELTRLHAVPALMRQICDTARAAGPWPGMRSLFVGGDRVPADLLQDLRPVFPNADIHVLYGPTEATILATSHTAQPKETGAPIGRPLDHVEITVADVDGRPVPIGVPGEIRIGGAGVARGYLNRPELNAEKFPNRTYRSGDLARWQPDGVLEFLGRVDDQVKVRGFRIEPGEVEAAIVRRPGVQSAAVLARDGRLEAFVVPDVGCAPRTGWEVDLQQALRAELPDYMVPAVWQFLSALPLTSHGKVDRRALAALEIAASPETPGEAEAPSGFLEQTVAAIFADVLGRERVGRRESFFDLGGHSLLATQVASRIRATLGAEIPLAAVFDTPTVAGLATAVEEVKGHTVARPSLERFAGAGDAPLSFAQQRLWFLDRLEPGTATYNLPVAVRLRGDLDVAALEHALGEIVHRHEALRTTFHEDERGPIQRIEPEGRFVLSLEEAGSEAVALQRMAEEAVRPFDLEHGPVFRALLLRIAPGDHLLVANLHHIVSDGWSMGVLVRELSAFVQQIPLPALPVQYADWARWQRRWLAGEVLETELGWWRETLRGLPERLDLPTDHLRRSLERRRGGKRPIRLGPKLTRDLAALARREGATLFVAVLAGFQALLARRAGQEDLAIGAPVAGRTQVEVEGLIGFFANTLVLRADLRGEPNGRELLRRTRRAVLAAHEHQHVPFEKLVEELAPTRELGRTPLFEAMLAFQNVSPQPPDLLGTTAELVPVETGTAKFDLLLDLTEQSGELDGSLEYDADLFEAVTIDRLLLHFEALLRGLTATPTERVADLPLLTDAEQHQLALEWNDRESAPPLWMRLHEGFERQAASTPEATALIWQEERLTYGELNERAESLATRLREAGAGPESVVGISLPRTPELIIAMLATLKAGAAYVPLDPSYPEERIAFIREDAGVSLVIREGLLPPLPEGGRGWDRGPGGEGLAYLIYTSGSTGRPKGVAIDHASAVRLIAWAGEAFSREELRGVLAATSVNFDLSIFEIFVPLSFGGAVILADDALALAGLPAAGEVTLINTVPSAMAALLELGPLPPSVRTVNLAGEPLRRPLADRVLAAGVDRLWNLYGPSEDTTYSTGEIVGRGPDEPTIGRPVAGSQSYVTDRDLRRQPIGVPGELCLGGGGVARGYLGRPALTAEKLVPDPFGTAPGGRLYRTGDLARWRNDGTLEYLGRLDRQVKIRGFRIEPGEVEAVLLGHPDVREAAVLPREGSLIAYAVVADEPGPDLRAWLQGRLPAPLVPSTFVWLESLPLTPNGKVDRAVLERMAPTGSAETFEPPFGPVEEALAAVWSEVLGSEQIGRRDGFFDRGGHSLLAAQVVSRIRRAFGVEIPLRALFEEPTLAGLAKRIDAATGEGHAESLAGLAGDGPAPLSFAQQRLWLLAQLDSTSPVYNLPAAVRLHGKLDPGALDRALAGVIRRHESLRTRFPLVGGDPVQAVEETPASFLPSIDLRALGANAEAEARRIENREAARPFDLQAGPLFRALLLRLDHDEHRLLVNMHHIVSDGWSLGVFIRELAALYAGTPLPELQVRYRDFAVWQRNRLSGEALERSLAFWRDELRGLPPGIDLPTDRPRPPVQTFRGAIRPFVLDASATARLREMARGEGATLFMGLLAGFQALLARWSSQEDFAVGTPVAGRSRFELEGLIGFFINTLVLRGDLTGDPDLRTLVRRARERFLAVQAWQDLPFEKVVEELRPERNLARPPVFQVLLVLQNAPRAPLALSGLDVTPEPVETGTAKLEIQLTLEEVDGKLAGALDFNRDLFDASTMDRFLGHYVTLLAAAVAEPGRRAGDLPILSPAEVRQLLLWNATTVAWPGAPTLPALFAAQADATPDRIAVRFEGESLSYRELDERSSRLAWRLRRLGIGPDVVAGVALERSLDLIVALSGIHKAGGAYLPLDLSHPTERLSRLLAESGVRVVVTHGAHRDRLAERATVVCLDREAESLAAESAARPPLEIDGDNLAYVIFTSGSTGTPKGAMNTHAAIANRILWMQDAYRLDETDRVLQKTPSTFDVSVWEFFWPLTVGARLVVARPEGHRDPSYLLSTILAEGITVLHFVPSMLQIFLGEPDIERAAGVRQVMASGEALPADLARRFFEHLPGARLHNLYGPTEAAVDVTAWTCEPGSPEAVVPIGRPIANLEIRVLDRLARPVPVGAPGELCIGGAGVARGYLGQPGLTAERFVPDPEPRPPGGRLYRTGDLSRWRPDGRLEYLGRLDHQVKIRGMRIEPGEIETALAAFPAVREAVVVMREDRPGDRRLVAYLVARDGALQLEHLRASLRERLPEPMVPSSFVLLEAFPVTANGKLDRRALPPPEDGRPAEPAVLPRTETEEAIAAAWREALGLEAVGVEDSFFDLGGHSLLVVQVHRRLAPLFPGLAVVDLFRYPTISALAGYLSKEKIDQISLEETRERAEDRTDRTRRQRELRRQVRGR
jgi:amino acid adenylation domain-containing protein